MLLLYPDLACFATVTLPFAAAREFGVHKCIMLLWSAKP